MGEKPLTDPGPDADSYCRSIETYLCRRNNGQLIRIVGPAFDLVRGWAERAVPLSVVYRGIDRRIERLEQKDRRNRRRRPVRIEFCEDDVLDVFEEWRRAVGVTTERPAPAEPLPAHLRRAIARLTVLRGEAGFSTDDQRFVDSVVRELDTMLAGARVLRGERRDAVLSRLEGLDRELDQWARRRCGDALADLRAEAERELEPFRERMPAAVYSQSLDAALVRLIRERVRVPRLALK